MTLEQLAEQVTPPVRRLYKVAGALVADRRPADDRLSDLREALLLECAVAETEADMEMLSRLIDVCDELR